MSSVRIHTPPVKLAKLLRTPGGLPVAEAVQRAGAGLASLKNDCLGELTTMLDQAEACALRAGADYDAALPASSTTSSPNRSVCRASAGWRPSTPR